MIIQDIRCSKLKIPLNRTFSTAIRTTNHIEDILVEIIADDISGFGSAPATTAITGDSFEGMQSVIENIFKPKLIGVNVLEWRAMEAKVFNQIPYNTGAKMAIDIAFYDLLAKHAQLPLWQYLGGIKRDIITDVSISCGSSTEVETSVLAAIENGYKSLKVKFGQSLEQDVQTCYLLNELVPKEISISVDANQAWSVKDGLSIINKLAQLGLNIEFIEQPVKGYDLTGMQMLVANSPYPIVADESVFTYNDVVKVLTMHAADMINIKLAKAGGISNAFKIYTTAEAFNIPCMLGCMMESPLGIAAASHFALSTGIKVFDLDPLDWVDEKNFIGLLDFNAPRIMVKDNIGIGF